MCYQQILLQLESGAFVGDECTESGVDIFEQAVLMFIANIKDVFHNCFLYNAKGSKYYCKYQARACLSSFCSCTHRYQNSQWLVKCKRLSGMLSSTSISHNDSQKV